MTDKQVPEGGLWGGIVIFSAFFIQVFAFGTSQSIGVYNIEFLRTFDAGAAAVSLVGSINLGIFLGAGPVCSILIAKWSHRQVALLGAALSNIGLVCMPFAPNLPYMYVFYGVITGLGYSLIYVPSHILSGLYYSRYRSLSTGVATAGSGFGATLFPIIIYKLIQYYGLRGSLIMLSGLNLHLFIFAALLRPVPKALIKAYEHQEKNTKETEAFLNENHDTCNANGSPGNDRVNYVNGIEENGLSQAKGTVETENLVNENSYIYDSSPDRIIEKYVNAIEVNYVKGKTEDDSSSTILVHAIDSPRNNTKNELSKSQRILSHFKTVFTFEFSLFWLSNIGWNAGGGIAMIFLPKYMTSVGITEENASIAFSVFGAGTCIGCVLGGLVGNIKCCDRIVLYICGNIGAGVFTLLFSVPRFHTFVGFVLLTSMFGLMFGIILGLLVVVTSDLLGTEALGYGFGCLMLANGVGIFCGPPFAGALIDYLGLLNPALYLAAGLIFSGGFVMSIAPLYRVCVNSSSATKQQSKGISIDIEC